KWPCRYHFDILAHTDSWKSNENIRMLANSFEKLMRTDRSEYIGLGAASWVGHVLGTVGCFAEGFATRYDKDGVSVLQFETIEWLCRCGLYPYLKVLQDDIEIIKNSINDKGFCETPVDEDQLKNISTYSGLQLEVDWKLPIRKLCDITFRALLILHFAEQELYSYQK
ncbi:MAG: hypothetical protein PHR37_07610, partial [Eubacteriales bacterium]|nr:hypothetical protein [Eubacteriales bacterium]